MVQELISVKEQLLRELDMYQEIAVSRGGEYDRLNQNMDRCQENIETLSDEIQRLQGTYFILKRNKLFWRGKIFLNHCLFKMQLCIHMVILPD